MKILVVVDMQNDFIDGALGTKEAIEIVPYVAEKIKSFPGAVLFTRDTHGDNYLHTQEGKKLPVPHCVKNTKGWMLHPEIELLRTDKTIDKPSFGSLTLGETLKKMNTQETIESVTLVGLCTDVCIISNAFILKAFLPEAEIIVDASGCAGVTKESHNTALDAMKAAQIVIE